MIYVMSDIHGNMRRFRSVMRQIRLKATDTLYILGDVIDRYPDGVKPNIKMLLGNHEYMMLNALYHIRVNNDEDVEAEMESDLELWYRNGGRITHQSLKHYRKTVRQEIFEYLKSLPICLDLEICGNKYKLVHSSNPNDYAKTIRDTSSARWFSDSLYHNETEYAIWKRQELCVPPPSGYTLIFGHTPTNMYQEGPLRIWHDKNRIGIDCGCAFPDPPDKWYPICGRLACLRLDDMKEFYSEESKAEGAK